MRTNAFVCEPQPACRTGQYLRAAGQTAKGTCTACANIVCPAGTFRRGVCTDETTGFTCANCTNAVCGGGAYRVGTCSGPFVCERDM